MIVTGYSAENPPVVSVKWWKSVSVSSSGLREVGAEPLQNINIDRAKPLK